MGDLLQKGNMLCGFADVAQYTIPLCNVLTKFLNLEQTDS